MTQQNRNSFKILSILSLLALASCAAESDNATSQSQYQAEVIRTEYGVAHITADSYGGLGYGEAYAAAEDHVCNMALPVIIFVVALDVKMSKSAFMHIDANTSRR